MPQRSNSFQRLVTLIERQLAGTSATVVESAMVPDGDGGMREVDVLITAPVGARSIVIAVECRDRKRVADRTWIDELIGKHRDLPVDRVVAVSRSGFTRLAEMQAAKAHIETLSLRQAQSDDWSWRDLVQIAFSIDAGPAAGTDIVVELEARGDGPEPPAAIDAALLRLLEPASVRGQTLRTFVQELLESDEVEEIRERFLEGIPPDLHQGHWNYNIEPDPPLVVASGDAEFRVAKLVARGLFLRIGGNLSFGRGMYGTASITFGHGEIMGRAVVLSSLERQGEEPALDLSWEDDPPK